MGGGAVFSLVNLFVYGCIEKDFFLIILEILFKSQQQSIDHKREANLVSVVVTGLLSVSMIIVLRQWIIKCYGNSEQEMYYCFDDCTSFNI